MLNPGKHAIVCCAHRPQGKVDETFRWAAFGTKWNTFRTSKQHIKHTIWLKYVTVDSQNDATLFIFASFVVAVTPCPPSQCYMLRSLHVMCWCVQFGTFIMAVGSTLKSPFWDFYYGRKDVTFTYSTLTRGDGGYCTCRTSMWKKSVASFWPSTVVSESQVTLE